MNGISKDASGSGGPRVHLRTAGAGLLGLLVGLVGGAFLARDEPSAEATRQRSTEAENGEVRATRNQASALSARPRERRITTGGGDGSPEPRLGIDPAILVDLMRTDQPPLEERVVLFSDGDLVASALGISVDERAALEREWARVKDGVVRLQRETLRHEQGEDQLWVGAGPFDGESLQTIFRETAMATLGPERGEAFLGMIGADEAFGEWGRRTSSAYSIQYDRQSDSSLVYRITERSSPAGPAGRSWISNRIPAHIRAITDALGIDPEVPGQMDAD